MDNQSVLQSASSAEDTVEHALDLLDRALTILDGEHLLVAAAKVDDARNAVRQSANKP
jgi:hypothetical protein